MRGIAIGWICLAACGGPADSAHGPHAPGAGPVKHARGGSGEDGGAADPLAALQSPDGPRASSWVLPGPIQLELGTSLASPPTAGAPIEVAVFDRAPGVVRVAVWLEHARFAVWTERSRLLPVLARDQRIEPLGPPNLGSDIGLTLHAGAVVERIGHRDKEKRSQIRYRGALEVEGWVPDAALTDRGPHDRQGRQWHGGQTMVALPGAVIRAEPVWAGSNNQLALVADVRGFMLDKLRDADAHGWSEVGYDDGEVSVRGFASTQSPPGALHRWPEPEPPLARITPNATAAAGTCLYARADGAPIGYLVGASPVELDDGASAAWWTLSLDSPWGPIAFAAKGASKTELDACGPATP